MVHEQDSESILQMIGEQLSNPAFVAEYETRLRMFHLAGGSGPLGAIALIDLLRSFQLGPKVIVKEASPVDWLILPGGAKVKVRMDGCQKHGAYCGKVDAGSVAVRFDGDSVVYEARLRDVRLEGDEDFDFPAPGIPAEDAAVPKAEVEKPVVAPAKKLEKSADPRIGKVVMVEYGEDTLQGTITGVRGKSLVVDILGIGERNVAPEAIVEE